MSHFSIVFEKLAKFFRGDFLASLVQFDFMIASNSVTAPRLSLISQRRRFRYVFWSGFAAV